MTTPRVWTFTSLGSGQATPLTLAGWQAPFGRARQGPLLNAGRSVRRTTTYYPGKNALPTVHTFGTVLKPFELHGRWMDQAIGTLGGAFALKRAFDALIADQQIVRAQWGELLSYKIFLHDFDAQLEDEQTIAWQLRADALQDESDPPTPRDTPAKNPSDMAGEVRALLTRSSPYSAPAYQSLLGLLGPVSDALGLLVSAVNQPAADFFSICDQVSDFESAAASDLGRLSASAQILRTAVGNLRDENEYLAAQAQQNEIALEAEVQTNLFSGPDWTRLSADNLDADAADVSLLALLADVQAQIDRVVRGQRASAVAAQDGDTFERLATRQYGSPAGARGIKDANAVKYGARPVAGRVYQLPKRVA